MTHTSLVYTTHGAARGGVASNCLSGPDSTAARHTRMAKIRSGMAIAQLCEAVGVTPRALRHYEAIGLLNANRGRRGERVFTAEQCERARRIVLLRRLNLSTADIRPLLDKVDVAWARSLRDVLEAKVSALSAELDAARTTLKSIEDHAGAEVNAPS